MRTRDKEYSTGNVVRQKKTGEKDEIECKITIYTQTFRLDNVNKENRDNNNR
jgi:hypothetical protein